MREKITEETKGPPSPSRTITVSRGTLITVVVALLLLFASVLWGLGGGPLDGGPAPLFTLGLFGGGELSLEDLSGQVVVVNFWASWCAPCREEAPTLERAWRAYKERGVAFVGVDYMDAEPWARAFIEEFDITYPNGPDLDSKIAHAYRIRGVPETFIVDREGNIAHLQIGPLDETTLVEVLESLLGGGQLATAGPIHAIHEIAPSRAPLTGSLAEGPPPDIEVSSTYYDFGSVHPSEEVIQEFTVRNLGQGDLAVTSFYTTCGCTTADLSAGIIPPGGQATLTIYFDPDFHEVVGEVERGVIIESNDPDEPVVEIWLHGIVLEP